MVAAISGSHFRWIWLFIPSAAFFVGYVFLFLSPSLSTELFLSPPVDSITPARLLEVPQIAWGLNNQKIALARALLTARFLNRSLLLPSLSASLTYKDTSHIQPLAFDELFSLPKFNSLCRGFVSIAKPSVGYLQNVDAFNISKGSGRRWTRERDLEQLQQCLEPHVDRHSLIRISGKNPFLWHDHWSVRDYARVFECLVLVDEISAEVDHIVSSIKSRSLQLSTDQENGKSGHGSSGYIAVHMRIEKDWMIHCKKTEERVRTRQGKVFNICSSKQEIIERVSHIPKLAKPSLVYLAVADILLENDSVLDGWGADLFPFEKKKLGLIQIYKKYPYLIQSALDYEVCLRADIFVGNTFSTFSSLIVLERTMKILDMKPADPCGSVVPSYAYNIHDTNGSPQLWVTNLTEESLQSISYGTNYVSCDKELLKMNS